MYYHFIVRLLNKKRYDEAFNLAKICFKCIRDEIREGSSNSVLQIEAKRYYNYMLYASRKAVEEFMAELEAERKKEKRFIDKLR